MSPMSMKFRQCPADHVGSPGEDPRSKSVTEPILGGVGIDEGRSDRRSPLSPDNDTDFDTVPPPRSESQKEMYDLFAHM